MIRRSYLFLAAICAFLAITPLLSVDAADWEESTEIAEIFKASGLTGTFVLFDVDGGSFVGYNKGRAETRFIPASTFKIPNSLIGLSVGAVTSVDEVLPYRRDPKPSTKAWEKDMGLREAIIVSNVPIYQALARRIGFDRMQDNLAKMDYGNNEIGTSIDTFWLLGPLMISSVEQTRFLAKLAQGRLPFPEAAQKSVRDITITDTGVNWTLHAKTGWQNAPDPGVGWWVGWVEKDNHVYAFALNIDIRKESDGAKRIELGKASLKALGII
ncbi:MAG: class D beta-lactamase [Thermodesulfobacteriota bacterium]